MPTVRLPIGKFLVAVLLTLCVGLQLLEATGRWDRSVQDAQDEAVIVAIVLCIGAAVAVRRAARIGRPFSSIGSAVVCVRSRLPLSSDLASPLVLSPSPPLPLR